MPRTTRDRSYKFPVTLDARKDQRIWVENCKKERAFQWNAKSPAEVALDRGANDVVSIRTVREKLSGINADYLWTTEGVEAPS